MNKNRLRAELYRAKELATVRADDYEAISDRMHAARKVLTDQLQTHEPYLSKTLDAGSWAEAVRRVARGDSYAPDLFCAGCGGSSWPCRPMTDIARAIAAIDGDSTDIDLSAWQLRVVRKAAPEGETL